MRACALVTCFLVQFYKSLSDHTLNKMKTENASAYSRDKGPDNANSNKNIRSETSCFGRERKYVHHALFASNEIVITNESKFLILCAIVFPLCFA